MFKCWIYISGENNSIKNAEGLVSDKGEVYKSKTDKENEIKRIDSYIPDMRKLNFFNRFVNF